MFFYRLVEFLKDSVCEIRYMLIQVQCDSFFHTIFIIYHSRSLTTKLKDKTIHTALDTKEGKGFIRSVYFDIAKMTFGILKEFVHTAIGFTIIGWTNIRKKSFWF